MNNDEVKNLKQGLQTIINLGFDNDGFETVSGLKGLIAEIVEIARSILKGEFCSVCHGYGWTIIDKETGEVRYCPNCKKAQGQEMEITCVICKYLTDCNYAYLNLKGYGCSYEDLCNGQRPLRLTINKNKKGKK